MSAPYQILEPVISLQASTDLSASQFCAVKCDTNGQAALPSANGAILGVLTNNPNAQGKACEIQTRGVAKMKLGGTVSKGDTVKVDSSGRAVTASGSDISSGFGVGVAITGGSSGEMGSIALDIAGSGTTATGGVQADFVLGTTAPDATKGVLYVSTTGTVTGALGAGLYNGQQISIIQSVAASTPVGTITGTYKNQAGTAKTTLALGTAVAFIGRFVWDGAAWRQMDALGGTGSSLS